MSGELEADTIATLARDLAHPSRVLDGRPDLNAPAPRQTSVPRPIFPVIGWSPKQPPEAAD
jgi:hypothetical protein